MFNQNKKKIEKEEQKDIEKRAQLFIEEYKKLCKKHEIELFSILNYTPQGIIGGLKVRNLKPSNVKKVKE